MPLDIDFKKNPELRSNQLTQHYFESPHKQIFEDFRAKIVKVTDGDTARLETDFRDFDFPLRIIDIDAPELNMEGGQESRDHLVNIIEGEDVDILIDPDRRTEKWGRLLGDIFHKGVLISEEMVRAGQAVPFDQRRETIIPNANEILSEKNWF